MIINCNETKQLWGKKHPPCISNVEKITQTIKLEHTKESIFRGTQFRSTGRSRRQLSPRCSEAAG